MRKLEFVFLIQIKCLTKLCPIKTHKGEHCAKKLALNWMKKVQIFKTLFMCF